MRKISFFYVVLFLGVFSLVLSSCEKDDNTSVHPDPTTLPISSFTYEIYKPNSTTAEVTFHNHSAYSKYWKWDFENGSTFYTDSSEDFVKTYPRPATGTKNYQVILVAYSDSTKTYENTTSKQIVID